MLIRVLLAGLPVPVRNRWQRLISGPNVEVASLAGRKNIWKLMASVDADLVFILRNSLQLPATDVVSTIRRLPEEPDLIVLTESENSEDRAMLLAAGCMAVLHLSVGDELLQQTVSSLIERRRQMMLSQAQAGRQLVQSRLGDFISASPAMQTFMHTVERVVNADTPLLISGETGVGKERLARAIHAESDRSRGPFIAVNCGAVPETLFESELFGHEEGAFTGATRTRRGHFELAHQGIIFLDEIGDLPLHMQVKLLRILQEGTFQRVGSEKGITINVRVIAATNRDIVAEQQAKRFRQDLYYRLAVVSLKIPPLRERMEDVAVLARTYVNHYRQRLGRNVRSISADALRALETYSWPGNVRELVNVIERAVLLCSGEEITLADFPESIGRAPESAHHMASHAVGNVFHRDDWANRSWKDVREETLRALERAYLTGVLRAARGRIGEAAKIAGMNSRSVRRKMNYYQLQKELFREKME